MEADRLEIIRDQPCADGRSTADRPAASVGAAVATARRDPKYLSAIIDGAPVCALDPKSNLDGQMVAGAAARSADVWRKREAT